MTAEFEQTIQQNVAVLRKFCRVYANNQSEYEELFQNMLIQIWLGLPKFRGDAQLSTWLYRVCINTALNYKTQSKKSKRFVPIEDNFAVQFAFEDEKDEQLKKLYSAIRELKPIDRAIVSLYLYQFTKTMFH